MKHLPQNILPNLPKDETLGLFLKSYGVPIDDLEALSIEELVEVVSEWEDLEARERMFAALRNVGSLDSARGAESMYEVVAFDEQLEQYFKENCESDLHRSFWLYVHHSELFIRASDSLFFDDIAHQASQDMVGIVPHMKTDDESLRLCAQQVCEFYKEKQGCGDHGLAHAFIRPNGNLLLTFHIKGLPQSETGFDGHTLQQFVRCPDIASSLEYCPTTGVSRSIVRGGAPYRKKVLESFATHVLGMDKPTIEKIQVPTLDLSCLRTGLQIPQAQSDGFESLQIKQLKFVSPENELTVEWNVLSGKQDRCATELIPNLLPSGNPLSQGWTIVAATINLYYPAPAGYKRRKTVSIRITQKGALNLHKYDEPLQRQLEGYLVEIGVLSKGQTLQAEIQQAANDDTMGDSVEQA